MRILSNIIGAPESRPNRFDEDQNSKDYAIKMGRWAISNGWNSTHVDWLTSIEINKRFWKNDQWVFSEDLEAFFKDDSQQARGRIKVINNFIRPIVEQYRANAIIMDLSFEAEPLSYRAINRREEKLGRLKAFTVVANEFEKYNNNFSDYLRSLLPIGKSESETESMFNAIYTDEFSEAINGLLQYVKDENDLVGKQEIVALDMALAGKATMKYSVYNGELVWDFIPVENHFWDRTAVKYDLSDAMYQGEYYMSSPEFIFEKYNPEEKYKKAIERSASEYGSSADMEHWGRIPIFNVYWTDFEKFTFGYVMDEFGYPYLAKINYVYDNEQTPRYTNDDVIKKELLNESQLKVLDGKDTVDIYCDVIRYVDFIPNEYVVPSNDDVEPISDIVLDYGVLPYQDIENQRFSSVQYPYKSYCWLYYSGEVESPISALINPQRMINRYASVMENIVNNAKGANVFYDKDAVDDEAELLTNMHQSKPVGVRAKRTGVHNIIKEYNPNFEGAMIYQNLVNISKNNMDMIAGMNEPMRGQSTSANQLVGVTQLQIQRASLIQEPYYNAITNIFKQVYETTANVGKRVYSDNERRLAIAVGDRNAKIIRITKDLNLEDFRTFVKRKGNLNDQIAEGDSLLIGLLQIGMLSQTEFADMFGRTTPSQVSKKLRQITALKAEAQRKAAEQQAAQEEQMMQQQSMQQQQMMDQNNEQRALDRDAGIFKEMIKSESKMANNPNQV